MTDIMVLPCDLAPVGLCLAGARRWCSSNNVDFKQFVNEGIPVSVLRATGCPLAERACQAAEERVRQEVERGQQ